jgi:hypothetical protein
MIRRSGSRPATLASNTAREMPRRIACGHSPARQLWKLAAAARIACAVISGWLEAPDSPLQSWVPVPVGAAAAPLLGAGALNSVRMSKLCPSAGTAQAVAAKATALRNPIDEANVAMAVNWARLYLSGGWKWDDRCELADEREVCEP